MNDRNNVAQLAVQNDRPITINAAPPLSETLQLSRILTQSGFFKDIKTEAQACAKILAGQELGIGPMASLASIHIVEGKPTLDASLVGAQIKKSGKYDYRIRRADTEVCTLEFFERGKSVGESTFTMEDAKRASLAGKNVWKSYPAAMLRSRAMTQGARMFCPDVFNGAVYDASELGADVDMDNAGTMRVVTPEAEKTQPRKQAAKPTETAQGYNRDEYIRLVNDMFSALGVDANGGKNAEGVEFVLDTVAATLGIDKPKQINKLSMDDLKRFLEIYHADMEQAQANKAASGVCEYCSMTDGTHRPDCPNDDENAEVDG